MLCTSIIITWKPIKTVMFYYHHLDCFYCKQIYNLYYCFFLFYFLFFVLFELKWKKKTFCNQNKQKSSKKSSNKRSQKKNKMFKNDCKTNKKKSLKNYQKRNKSRETKRFCLIFFWPLILTQANLIPKQNNPYDINFIKLFSYI